MGVLDVGAGGPTPTGGRTRTTDLCPGGPNFGPTGPIIINKRVLVGTPVRCGANHGAIGLIIHGANSHPVRINSRFRFFRIGHCLRFSHSTTFNYRLGVPTAATVHFRPNSRGRIRIITCSNGHHIVNFGNLIVKCANSRSTPACFPTHVRTIHGTQRTKFGGVSRDSTRTTVGGDGGAGG